MVRTGVLRAYGGELRRHLGRSMGSRFSAFLAGLGTGVWDSTDALRETWSLDRRFEPSGDRETADAAHRRWLAAVERSKGWAEV